MTKTSEANTWAGRYGRALRERVARGLKGGPSPAPELGRRAVALGMETLDVAEIHVRALAALEAPGLARGGRRLTTARASRFFAEVIAPIERTHRAARDAQARVEQLTRTLRRRTLESAASARDLKRSIAQRRASEATLRSSAGRRLRMLRESRRLQRRLRSQTRLILAGQEDARRAASLQLQDDIAQTLLAIHIRLLNLKGMAEAGTADLKKEIAETRRVVGLSAKTIARLDHESSIPHDA